jgi:phthalate 4,5-dioxygenase oxygenase subunit
MIGPDTVDGIAPAGEWAQWWREAVRAKRQASPWCAGTVAQSVVA